MMVRMKGIRKMGVLGVGTRSVTLRDQHSTQ